MPRLLLLAALATLASGPAFAQTCSTEWAAPVDGSWSDDARWTNGAPGTETGGLNPCITVPGTYAVMSGDTDRSFTSLVLGGASGTQTLTSSGVISVPTVSVLPNGRWEFLNRTPGGQDGLYSTGTVTVEGEVAVTGGVSFLNTGGTLDVAPGGTFRVSNSARVGSTSGLFRVRGTVEGVGCPFPITNGQCTVLAPVEVLGGTLRAASGVLQFQGGGTMNGATLDAGPTSLLRLNADLAGPPYQYTVEGTIQGTPQGTVGIAGVGFAAGPAGATLAVGGTGLQMIETSFMTSAGGSFTNTGLLLKPATGSNFSGIRNGVVRNQGVIEIPSSLGLYVGGVLRNEPGGVVRATAGGRISGDGDGTGRFENAGMFVLDAPGQSFTFADGGFGNDSGPFSQPGSELRIVAGTLDLTGPGSRNLPDGATLTGAGAIVFPRTFQPEGTVSPGTDAQPLARLAHGQFYFPSPVVSRLVIDVDTEGRSDTLDVSAFGSGGSTSLAILAGTLVVRVRPGYVPAAGDTFTILTALRPVTGQFEQIAVSGAPDGITFEAETSSDGLSVLLRAVTAVANEEGSETKALALRAYPNPVHRVATLALDLGEAGPVRVEVLDALGRRVAALHDGPLAAGTHTLPLDVSSYPPGVYTVRTETGGGVRSQRLTVIR